MYLSDKPRLQEQQPCLGNNGIPQTGVTLAYTIKPFGASAGCVFIGMLPLPHTTPQFRSSPRNTPLAGTANCAQAMISPCSVLNTSHWAAGILSCCKLSASLIFSSFPSFSKCLISLNFGIFLLYYISSCR